MTSEKSGILSQSGSAKSCSVAEASRGSASPFRAATASGREPTGYTFNLEAATTASETFCAGTISFATRLNSRAINAAERTPRTGRTMPSNASSPRTMASPRAAGSSCPVAAISPSAIGRSNPAPSFLMSAGARFTSVAPEG